MQKLGRTTEILENIMVKHIEHIEGIQKGGYHVEPTLSTSDVYVGD